MSNRLFQGVINQMKDAIGRSVGVLDSASSVIACTELSKIGGIVEDITIEAVSAGSTVTAGGYTYRAFGNPVQPEYLVFVEGTDPLADKFAQMLTVSLENIKKYYDEKYDRCNFIKNVMLDNILPGDVFTRAKELHFASDVIRVIILVRLNDSVENNMYETIQTLFPDKNKDFIVSINMTDVAIIKEIGANVEMKDLKNLARSIIDSLGTEYAGKVVCGIGSSVESIRDLSKSFKEAQVALEVRKVFDTERTIVSYENLGIARLIYQLPNSLCDMFLKEVFKKDSIESLDHETLFTIQKFFENNLNVSETSRKLFVHRNTLVYRLEKIRKITGLDLREFDDAIIFKVALMVKKYLDSAPIKY